MLKLQIITRLRQAIKDTGKEVERVVHICVVDGDVSTFRFKAAEGTGQSNCETEYDVKICHAHPLEKMQFTVAHEAFESLELASGYVISVHNDTKLPPRLSMEEPVDTHMLHERCLASRLAYD